VASKSRARVLAPEDESLVIMAARVPKVMPVPL
jgi:hypothetical protein